MRLVRPSLGSWVLTVSQRSKTKRLLTPVESLKTEKAVKGGKIYKAAGYDTQRPFFLYKGAKVASATP